MEALPAEYRHEPTLGLAGGDDGMDAVRAILREAPRFLSPDGVLAVEVGSNRGEAEAAFPRMPFTWLAQSDDAVFVLRREQLVAGR